MADSLLVGAAVGAVFGELLKAVLDVKDKALMFKPTLANLTRTLKAIDPLIKEIEQNNNLGRPKEELESLIRDMEEGTKLVYKCSKISRINIYGRLHYQEELVALAESMERFFKIDMQAQIARDLKETLSKVRRIHSAVHKLPFLGACSSSSNNSAAEAVDLGQLEVHEPTDEDAVMEINSVEETVDSDTLRSTPCKDADGITSAEQVMEDINSFSQKNEAKADNSKATNNSMNKKSYNDQLYMNKKSFLGIRLPEIKLVQRRKEDPFEPRKSPAFEGRLSNSDVQELLSASAEFLGKTKHASSYKVRLKDGTTLVVKRLTNVSVEKKEFERQMEIAHKISQHPNVMPLRAWYNCKDEKEKLLICDYMAAGNLSELLHGARRTSPDWNSRMKILLGVAKGIAHIHSASGEEFVHGNISSSNVLITVDFQGRISDLVITSSVGDSFDPFGKIGYHPPPEVMKTENVTQKSDVYSFGILLFEMLTGKLPLEPYDLPGWVMTRAMDGLLYTVFDYAIQDNKYASRQILRLANACVAGKPDLRPSMNEVVMKMEEIIASGSN